MENVNSIFKEGEDIPFQKASDENAVCDDEVTLAAQKSFGITYLYPWQRIVIANILDASKSKIDDTEENDVVCKGRQIVLLPTGAGKSLCFLTPALLLSGPTLVLYPLLALMTDQKRRMDEGGISSVTFRGGQTKEEREENFKKIKDGAKIILANPEVLQSAELIERLKECNIAHLAIDEAHCVSEWGDTFRPAYLTLGKIITDLNIKVVTAFTATASPQVLGRISEVLFGGAAHIVRSESDRPNIHYEVINTYAKKRTAFELAIQREKPLIIFCGTRKKSEDMARELAAYYGNDKVKFYHAGLEKEEKEKVEKWFYPKTDGILCCTCAFGMGVDKKDIHTVIHLEPSPTAESYIQEAGRGGRDGSIANAILLWSAKDSLEAKKFHPESREAVLKKFAESTTCRRQVLLDALGGEQAACDGCDICKNKKIPSSAKDAEKTFTLLKKNFNNISREKACQKIVSKMNRENLLLTKINVWDHSDVSEIVEQLEQMEFIKKVKIPKILKRISKKEYFKFAKKFA